MENKNETTNNKKILIGILIALILLIVGFYLYYFYPQAIPGMAGLSPALKEDINVLAIGLDDLESVTLGEIEVDSMVLFKFQAEKKNLELINIPIKGIEYSEGTVDELINEVYELTGIKPSYYITVSYQGFENLVDSIDGISIELDKPLSIPDLDLELKAGLNQLSGHEALNYARWYDYKKDEIDRIKRQQQVIAAIMEKIKGDQILGNIPQIFSTTVHALKSVDTNIDIDLVKDIVEFVKEKNELNINYSIFSTK